MEIKKVYPQLEQVQYDLILMDTEMPEIDGIEATARIRVFSIKIQPVIVALTTNGMNDDRAFCMRLEWMIMFSKTFQLETMVKPLEKWVNKMLENKEMALH